MKVTCYTCKKKKNVKEFRTDKRRLNGYSQPCKECDADKQRARYAKNPEKVRSFMREHYKRNKKKYHEKAAKWAKENPEKYSAHMKVRDAVKSGKLKREPCEVCGSMKVEGHHEDYSKPLGVRWLCSIHHGEVHRKENL